MGNMWPWLIAGWILFGDKLRGGRGSSSTSTPNQGPQQQQAPTGPPLAGFLFRLPSDGYDTTRLAINFEGGARTVGIFQNPTEALKVVLAKGWQVPPEIQQLSVSPDEAAMAAATAKPTSVNG